MAAKYILCFVALYLHAFSSCFGFGDDGHQIIGAVAQSNLTAEAAQETASILNGKSLAEVATWADKIRNQPEYFFAKPLHYINVPRSATTIDESRDCVNGACVTAAIQRYAKVLGDRSRSPAERAEALKFVVHFVGDVHQPLHVSYKDDRGGNSVKVKWLGKAGWSLHSVWDTGFARKLIGSGDSWQKLASEITHDITPVERAKWGKSGDPKDWANESLQLTRKIYKDLPADHNLTAQYYQDNVGIFEGQLAAAGIRLANLLNHIFSDQSVFLTATTTSSDPIMVCTFNIQFLGQSKDRDNAALADVVKGNDIVVIQELIAPPYTGHFPDGAVYKPNPNAAHFFDAMKANGFGYVMSEEDTGKGKKNHLNSTATEWWVVFFKSNRVDYATDLPHGFLSTTLTSNPDFDRVPYAFGFRSKNHNEDFVLISVHLRPSGGTANRMRRAQELGGIARWINAHNQVEKDFIILGDMNMEDGADLKNAMPTGLVTLNDKLEPTNTNVNGPKPYDQVMFNPGFTGEIDRTFGFQIIHLVERMKDYWGKSAPYPGDEPYDHDTFRKYYTDHNPVVFQIKTDRPDDD